MFKGHFRAYFRSRVNLNRFAMQLKRLMYVCVCVYVHIYACMFKKALLSPWLLLVTRIYSSGFEPRAYARVSKNIAEFSSNLISIVVSIEREVLFLYSQYTYVLHILSILKYNDSLVICVIN